jgi:hypothetical protein
MLAMAIMAVALLSGCKRDDPQAALDAAANDLQAALEAHDARRALDLLHPSFSAQTPEDDREWAGRTMTMMFMRYKNIHILIPWREHRLDARVPDYATSEAEISLLGAEGLLPERSSHYRVKLHWRRENGQWKLLQLKWE